MSKAVEIEGYMLRVHTRHYDKVNGVVVCYKDENDKMFFPFRRSHGEWTTESAIDYLTDVGWLPEHDRILTETRPHGEWVEVKRYNRKGKRFLDCSVCHYGEKGEIVCEVTKLPNFCPNCGASMSASYRQVTGKLDERR